MKNLLVLFLFLNMVFLSLSCEDTDKRDDSNVLTGEQSEMGKVGVTVTSSSAEIAGVSNASAVVDNLENGISSYSAQATVTNDILKNMIANFPGVLIDGDNVSVENLQIQQTTGGIKCITGPDSGILINYNSNVGDTYPIGSTGRVRTVVSKTGVDDYPYGFYLIKTIQVESNRLGLRSATGVSKITYIANHKFGMVGVKVTFTDGSSAIFPVYSSTQN
jgi:hypothetical protein